MSEPTSEESLSGKPHDHDAGGKRVPQGQITLARPLDPPCTCTDFAPDMRPSNYRREFALDGRMVLERVNGCTCGTSGYGGAHEPHCGWEPVDFIDDLVAKVARQPVLVCSDERHAEQVAALEAEVEASRSEILKVNAEIIEAHAEIEKQRQRADINARAVNDNAEQVMFLRKEIARMRGEQP